MSENTFKTSPNHNMRYIIRDGEKILQENVLIQENDGGFNVSHYNQWRDVPTELEDV